MRPARHRPDRSRALRPPPGGSGRGAGFTLLELLLVMLVLSVLFGLGIGMFSSLDVGERQVLASIESTLRATRDASVSQRAPSRVRLDHERGALVAEALEVVGTWHFENEALEGAYGIRGASFGARVVDEGYVGRGVSFLGAPRDSRVVLPVADRPEYDVTNGFSLEIAVYLEADASAHVVNLGKVGGVDVLPGGRLRGWFVPAVLADSTTGTAGDAAGSNEERSAGSHVLAETRPGVLSFGRWARVRVDYDRRALSVWVDGVLEARTADDAPVWPAQGDLSISDPRSHLPAVVDNLVVRVVAAEEEVFLPDGVRLVRSDVREVGFDAEGRLDRREHRGPVEITVEYADGARRSVRVGIYGTVE